MRYICFALLLTLAWPLTAQEDNFRIMKLEQDVRNLERQVGDLSRQVEDLKQQLTRPDMQAPKGPKPGAASAAPAAWINAGNWDRVRSGMSELEVISILGLPTSMRTNDRNRVLLYATEIGPSDFLSGSVTLRDGEVTEVTQPVLK